MSSAKIENQRDHHRHYFAHKAVKDYMILTKKTLWSKQDIDRLFTSHALINYLNDLYLNSVDKFLELRDNYKMKNLDWEPMIQRADRYRSVFRGVDQTEFDVKDVSFNLTHADIQADLAWKFDAVYVYLTEMLTNQTFNLMHEQLLDYDSFETRNGHPNYFPLVDPQFPVEYFELPEG